MLLKGTLKVPMLRSCFPAKKERGVEERRQIMKVNYLMEMKTTIEEKNFRIQ